ncbi:zinc ribbon domain-containing protein [Chitinivibrio alkaliphilus]|nr:zinc ribbon domain-containing protein [Chitinivibrio alkaliphilus]
MQDTWNCPFCNFELARDAQFCPNCGSDESTGWSDMGGYDQNDLHEHDYEQSVRNEFGHTEKHADWQAFVKTVIILLLIVLLFFIMSIF